MANNKSTYQQVHNVSINKEKLAEMKEAMEERLALTELEVVRYERREMAPAFASAEASDGAEG